MPRILIAAAIYVIAVVLTFGGQATAQDAGLTTVLVMGKEKYTATILSDRIAGVVDEKLSAGDSLKDILSELKAEPLAGFGGQLVSIPATGNNSASMLTGFARKFRAGRSGQFAATGIQVLIGDSKSPIIITDQIIVQVEKDPALVKQIADKFGAAIVAENPFDKNQFVIELAMESGKATLDVSNAINEIPGVAFAHPNFYQAVDLRQTPFIPNDRYFANQWHLNNTGQNGGTPDADIDADLAWSFTKGSSSVIIAVIDSAFEINHPDLAPNLWTNAGEIANDTRDNDGNGFVNDIHGWDFDSCGPSQSVCGDADVSGGAGYDFNHGTSTAGAAVARGNNSIGVSGSCPQCTFMPLKAVTGSVYGRGLAFGYAQSKGARIISNSWGLGPLDPIAANVRTAIDNAINGGVIVLFALPNPSTDACTGTRPDYASIPNVFGISSVTNQNEFGVAGFGDCVDVLGPSVGRLEPSKVMVGTLAAVTTDRQGAAGYNNDPPDFVPNCNPTQPASDLDYTFCFRGTSFATPVVAGVAGLALSLDSTLTRLEVQRIIQDTADKVENSAAAYSERTGYSAPTGSAPTHGFGRVNAFEAARLVAPVSAGGRGGVDIFIRDNKLDWGNTEKLSSYTFEQSPGYLPHWQSVDIKVDAAPFRSTPPATSADFDSFVHENPLSNSLNKVYVRIHNRGPRAATNAKVKLHWAFAGAGLPALPTDFWSRFPNDSANTSVWHPLGTVTASAALAYSGASTAGSATDASMIATFDFNAPVYDASAPGADHYCLFAVLSSNEDPVSAASMASLVPDVITPRDNNVTHRNVQMIDTGNRRQMKTRLMVSNPFGEETEMRLSAKLPEGWKAAAEGALWDKPFKLAPGKTLPVTISIEPGPGEPPSVIDVIQTYRHLDMKMEEVLGGTSFMASGVKE